mmetsp:Transcript_1973/g.6372  ORF Transcript_1973/g.6372 Transcript_1973/m.6372 type:complete len:102 (+) Transcript_1973:93-398(+)
MNIDGHEELIKPPQPPPSSPPSAGAQQDPHIYFAHGGQSDFRGEDGVSYNFFPSPGISLSIKTEDATFLLHGGRLVVHGSFITEAHLVAGVGVYPREAHQA